MTPMFIDRREVKRTMRAHLDTAQVPTKPMTALYLGIVSALSIGATYLPSLSMLDLIDPSQTQALTPILLGGTFLSVFIALVSAVLNVGFVLYCMAVHKEEETEYLDLVDGFSMAGRIIYLLFRQFFFTYLWSLLFFIPGIIAAYRYRFAMLNLCEHPDCSPRQAMELSKVQTMGYKTQLLMLDVSYILWGALAQLPYIVLSACSMLNAYQLANITLPSLLVQNIVCSACSIAVGVFYLAHYQVCEIEYFEIAKSTCAVQYKQEERQNPLDF